MEFDLRAALFLIGVIVIAGILLDGLRRKSAHKKTASQPASAHDKPDADFDLFAGDLGAPRVIKKKADTVSSTSASVPRKSADVADGLRVDEQASELSDHAVSYEAIGSEGIVSKPRKVSYREAVQHRSSQPETETVTAGDDEDMGDYSFGAAEVSAPRRASHDVEMESLSSETQSRDSRDNRNISFDDVIVINVMAKPKDDISGNDLLRALLSVGLRFGDMNIFHRHEQLTGKGAVLFSAVNVVEPGTFDLNRMEDFKTPGICMFLRLPGPKRSLHAFEQLVESARKIANMLGAELKDENHSVLTHQTIEHYRQRVLDFERKMLSHRAQR